MFYRSRARFDTTREIGEQLLTLAEQSNDTVALMLAHQMLGQTAFYLGEFLAARKHSEMSLALYDRESHQELAVRYQVDFGMLGLNYLAWSNWFLGYPDKALVVSHEALNLAREIEHPFSEAYSLGSIARVLGFRREPKACLEWATQQSILAEQHAFKVWHIHALFWQGWARAQLGEWQEGLQLMRDNSEAMEETGSIIWIPLWLTLMADVHCEQGHQGVALATTEEAERRMNATGECFYEAELHRILGDNALKNSEDESAASSYYQRALTTARKQNAKSLELRAAIRLARIRHRYASWSRNEPDLVKSSALMIISSCRHGLRAPIAA